MNWQNRLRISNNRRERKMFEAIYYEVVSIDGDYANLKKIDDTSDDLKLVARALLPESICEGSRVKYEMMSYSISE